MDFACLIVVFLVHSSDQFSVLFHSSDNYNHHRWLWLCVKNNYLSNFYIYRSWRLRQMIYSAIYNAIQYTFYYLQHINCRFCSCMRWFLPTVKSSVRARLCSQIIKSNHSLLLMLHISARGWILCTVACRFPGDPQSVDLGKIATTTAATTFTQHQDDLK